MLQVKRFETALGTNVVGENGLHDGKYYAEQNRGRHIKQGTAMVAIETMRFQGTDSRQLLIRIQWSVDEVLSAEPFLAGPERYLRKTTARTRKQSNKIYATPFCSNMFTYV